MAFDWPTDKLHEPAVFEWITRDRILRSESPLTGALRTSAAPFAQRWGAVITLRQAVQFSERAAQEATVHRMRGGAERVNVWHMAHPAPYGTMRGSPTMAATASQGARTASIQATAGETLLAGDMIGVALTAGGVQLLRIVSDATANGSGVLSATFEPALRGGVSSGSAVTWDRPKVPMILIDDSIRSAFEPMHALPMTIELVEVLS